MELRLKVMDGKHAGQEIRIPGPKFLIGRGEDCQLRPKSDSVSRRHCMLEIAEGRVTICDLGSRNGTLVNDKRVEGQFALKTGDRLAIGQLKFEVNLTTGLKAAKQPVVKDVKDAAARTREHKSSDEMDVDSWLKSGDPVGSTREFSDAEPERASVTETAAGIDAETIVARTAKPAETPAPDPKAPKTPGKLPPRVAAADGGAAAADILRRLSKYR